MARKRKVVIKTYLKGSDATRLHQGATRLGLSVSEYMHLIVMRLINREASPLMRDLSELRSDLTWHSLRLPNAIKKTNDLEELTKKIQETNRLLESKIRDL